MKKIFTVLALALASMSAHAEHTNVYATVDVGRSELSNTASSVDGVDKSYSVTAGVQLHENFAVEAGYTDLGKFSSPTGSVKLDAWKVAAVGRYAVTDNVAVVGKLGYANVDGYDSVDGHDSKSTVVYGIGAEVALNKNWAATANVERFNKVAVTDNGLTNVTAGIKYNF